MLRKWYCQADVAITIEPVDPVLVRSGHATIDGADMAPVSTHRNGQRTYYLPGTSLKGVLRSHFERIARTLRPGSVCLPYYHPKRDISVPVEAEKGSHGCGFRARGGGGDSASAAYADSCAACRLFGSLKFAGRFSIGDAYPVPGHQPVLDSRNGVGIDRFTGGTVRGVLFELQALVGGKFEAHLRLTNYELWQLAALGVLLEDLADEVISVGSGRSRGLGRVRTDVESFRLSYLGSADALVGIGQAVAPEEREAYRLHDWKPETQMELGTPEARGLRRQYDMSTDWSERLEGIVPALQAFLEWHGGPGGEVSDARAGREART